MSWFKRKSNEVLTSKEFQEIEKKLIDIDSRISTLEFNYRLLSGKVKKTYPKLPSEEKEDDAEFKQFAKDFYRGVLLPE